MVGTETKTSYGRIGKTPRHTLKQWKSKDKAQKYYDTKVSEKKKEGYKVVKSPDGKDEDQDQHDEDNVDDVLDHALGLLSSLKVPAASRKAKAVAIDACSKLAASLQSNKRSKIVHNPPGFFLKLREVWGDASTSGLMDSATYLVSDLGSESMTLSEMARQIWDFFLAQAFPKPTAGDMYGSKAYVNRCKSEFELESGDVAEKVKAVTSDGILDGTDDEISKTFEAAFGGADDVEVAHVGDGEVISGFVAAGRKGEFLFGWALLND